MPPERIEISTIPQDLRHEETIVQIAEALDDLNYAVNHIFDSINERISENNKRLGAIRQRATKIQGQLEHLQTNLSLKAVKMYSAAKYPANHTYKEYKLAVLPKSRKEIPANTIYKSPVPILDKSDTPLTTSSKVENGQYASNVNMQEKLQFYYVKSKPTKKTKVYEVEKDQTRQNVTSIDSLLPFNKSDSRNVNAQSDQKEKKGKIEDAPDSILQPWHSSEMESPSTYLYAPTLGEVPQINVPLSLPDLPGIVDDERFMLDLNFQSPIAPSSAVATPTARKDLPTIPNTDEQDSEKLPAVEAAVPKAVKAPSTLDELPLPPVVPAPSAQIQLKMEEPPVRPIPQAPAPVPSLSAVPPPPPPPPPPPLPLESPEPEAPREKAVPKTGATKKPITVKSPITDDRSNLMAAIRDAGGLGKAKLRSAAAAAADKSKDRWSSASVGNDLMADLHNTLSLRRKGIAGLATNTLARLSVMIPPPPKPSDSSDRNSTSESQDDDGWDD